MHDHLKGVNIPIKSNTNTCRKLLLQPNDRKESLLLRDVKKFFFFKK